MTISVDNPRKLQGGYYTPQRVADWLARWAVRSGRDCIVEPSCGDGAFLAAALTELHRHETLWDCGASQVTGIELVREEAEKARIRTGGLATVVNADFFDWLGTGEPSSADVVLGNPPFIRYQSFPEPSRSQAMRFMQAQGLKPNRLTNIWVPFVVAGTTLLRPGGRIGMVLPAELLQVSYAAQLRQYLAHSFRRITIFACNEMFFDRAEQEVVLVAAEGKLPAADAENRCDIRLNSSDRVADLIESKPTTRRRRGQAKLVHHDSEKWLKYFLDAAEIQFMRDVRRHPEVSDLTEHATVDVGVVTGKNEFFVLDHEQVAQNELHDFVVPLVGRSSQIPGVVLRARDHKRLGESGKRVFLLHTDGRDGEELPAGLRTMIAQAERRGFHQGYKCRIRKPWYRVPSVWEPDCFFFRQIYDFPRVVVNKAKATSTDTIHRMRCRRPAARVASNLYTHLTAASAEIEGRSYGGGVLELEPTEAERLLVPKQLNGAMPIAEADRLVRSGRLADVLEENDRLVLKGSLGLSSDECKMLKGIWAKMRDRRMARKRA